MLGRITLAMAALLIIWGNMVAGLQAGLACPDWPLCHGSFVPPYRWDIYMEFTHRVLAAITGPLIVALSYSRFRTYAGAARAVPVLAVAMLAAEIIVGGFVVIFETPVKLTTFHFMTGFFIFSLTAIMAKHDGLKTRLAVGLDGPKMLTLGLGGLVFFQAALGAFVRHSDAGLACPDFPTCQGRFLPIGLFGGSLIHYSHRLVAVLLAFTMLAVFAMTQSNARFRALKESSILLCFLAFVQLAAGAVVVLTGLNFIATAVHLGVALGMVYVVVDMYGKESEAEAAAVLR
ncbi:MAG TPA: COX15/CtaA family protein [Nitrospirota bacterium]